MFCYVLLNEVIGHFLCGVCRLQSVYVCCVALLCDVKCSGKLCVSAPQAHVTRHILTFLWLHVMHRIMGPGLGLCITLSVFFILFGLRHPMPPPPGTVRSSLIVAGGGEASHEGRALSIDAPDKRDSAL